MLNNPACVITTINQPTASVRALEKIFGNRLYAVADEKTPKDWECGAAQKFSVDAQTCPFKRLYKPFKWSPVKNHYARKNIGYLMAMRLGTDTIFDTDDDNTPYRDEDVHENFVMRSIETTAEVVDDRGWHNIYLDFYMKKVWPRGFPIKLLNGEEWSPERKHSIKSPVQQLMVNGDADVDAIWRMITKSHEIDFIARRSMALSPGTWCPFNSQATWWFKEAFPLMYLPIHASFRMTDIWRSFVAQRCLWAMGRMVTFHSPAEVFQKRNEHDLLKDFESEIPGYLHNEVIAKMLGDLRLKRGKKNVCKNLMTCYEAMIAEKFLPKDELKSVAAWIEDIKRVL